MMADRAAVQEAVPEMEPGAALPDAPEEGSSKQRGKIWVPKLFDYVQIWSKTTQSWHNDGVVIEALTEAIEKDNLMIPAGSIKVWFNSGKWLKWLPPADASEYTKPSDRPKPPDNFRGELKKETHNLITTWNTRYCLVSGGIFQWWLSEEDFAARKPE